MKTQVIDRSGVLLAVAYEPESPATQETPGTPITFVSVHVLDGDYKPIGPNIINLLDGMVVMINAEEATPFFCAIHEDLVVPA